MHKSIKTKQKTVKNNQYMLLQYKQHSRQCHNHTQYINTTVVSYDASSSSLSSTSFTPHYCYIIVVIALIYILLVVQMANAAPQNENINRRIWPPMKHHDIWSAVAATESSVEQMLAEPRLHDAAIHSERLEFLSQQFKEESSASNYWRNNNNNNNNNSTYDNTKRRRRVIHLFPVPVDGECLSDDGRRTGICHNAYECRLKGGAAKGECARGFGVCCIFMVNCSTNSSNIINNNITYLVSPNFPSFMPHNLSACNLKVKLMSNDVSQLRIDFFHFSLGQPNRRTGVCDGDIFNISGGPSGDFTLCGQNSGQHLYYDVGGRALPRQTLYGNLRPLTFSDLYGNRNNTENLESQIEISMNFTQRFLPQRLWEIRITQIPFSQRAPAGCLQYHTGNNGFIQTFNFADNGRHLANQNYRICIRQESSMCSILYETCDEQSFRIGPIANNRMTNQMMQNTASAGMTGMNGAATAANMGMPSTILSNMPIMPSMNTMMNNMAGMVTNMASSMSNMLNMGSATTPMMAATSAASANSMTSSATTAVNMLRNSTVMQSTTPSTPDTPNTPNTPNTPATTTAMSSSSTAQRSSTTTTTTTTTPTTTTTTTTTMASSTASLDDYEDEGSGAGITPTIAGVSRRPRPVSGGFDLLGFLRSAFDFNARQSRQLMSSCRDRITMPCIIEDFIGTGLGPLPGCEPVHCGAQFCSSGITPCRMESTVTPFYIGVHFGEGMDKGSAEDNIGACLRYTQIQCT